MNKHHWFLQCKCFPDFELFLYVTTVGQFEIREALALHKPLVLVHESDPRFGAFDFRAAREKAPPDLQDMLDNHESLPFRRRGYERDGMLQTLIEHAGFKALLDGARASASTKTSKELAKVPTEIQHFDLESHLSQGKTRKLRLICR